MRAMLRPCPAQRMTLWPTFGLLVAAGVFDLALAFLMIAVSAVIFTGGEAMHRSDAIPWVIGAAWCIAAPIVGFLLRRAGKAGVGVLIAVSPLVMTLVFLVI